MNEQPTGTTPRPPWRVIRFARARRRLTGSLVIGIITFFMLPVSLSLLMRLLIGWDVITAIFLILAYTMIWQTDASHVRRNAVVQDEGRFSILVVTAAAAFASLAAIIAEH